MNKKQSLSVDIESLFPGTTVPVGNQTLTICPLNLEQIALLTKKVVGLVAVLSEKGITRDNFNKSDNIVTLAIVLLENFPDVLEELSNVEITLLKKLPIEIVISIVQAVVSENLKSKEALEKNFKSLIERFLPLLEKTNQNQDEDQDANQTPETTPESNEK